MGRKKHVVDLSDEDRRTLEWFISTGERKSEDNTRARILLKADDGLTDSAAQLVRWKRSFDSLHNYRIRWSVGHTSHRVPYSRSFSDFRISVCWFTT